MAKLTREAREKRSAASARSWANMTPEERAARVANIKKAKQLSKMRRGLLHSAHRGVSFIDSTTFIDSDFDEGL